MRDHFKVPDFLGVIVRTVREIPVQDRQYPLQCALDLVRWYPEPRRNARHHLDGLFVGRDVGREFLLGAPPFDAPFQYANRFAFARCCSALVWLHIAGASWREAPATRYLARIFGA